MVSKLRKTRWTLKVFGQTVQTFATVSQGMWTQSGFFPHRLDKTVKEKHCFDRNAGRVPVTL